MDIIILFLLLASIGLNIALIKRVELLQERVSKERRKQLVYKSELNLIPRDYEENESSYDGIVGDR